MEPDKSDCKQCARLIRLCSVLDYFPADITIRRLLVEWLHRLASSHDHAKRMINRWLASEKVTPKPADLSRLAQEVERGHLPTGCEVCGNGFWICTEKGARRCTCARGLALKAMERT
jgi:hypothetical protein